MATIPLRAYDREIEQLIEKGDYDQPIAHCKHILKYFPKHIDTYRLLGKAYLESQRYGDAADIFQRVLSSIPEDFVSHVGMSIIREDEGNLDEAIWHMERAFEMQPGNNAVQNELKRLFGRRDGIEPPKINLTRGALARMYVKGSLFQQAIAEIRISLAEDPDRLDLRTLLARAYFMAGQSVEAAETSKLLLNKLPFSYDANSILAEITARDKGSLEATEYKNRLFALNPYSAHLSPTATTPDLVPDTTIMVEKLEWQEGAESGRRSEEPAWASMLGIEIAKTEPEAESLPDWLPTPTTEGEESEQASSQPSSFELGEQFVPSSEESPAVSSGESSEQQSDGLIPTWMREAGWESGNGSEGTTPPSDFVVDESGGEHLEPADIPDWLKSLAPESADQEETPSPEAFPGEAVFPWLESPPKYTSESAVEPEQDEEEAQSADLTAGAPFTSPTEEMTSSDMKIPEVELPDWLKELESEPGQDLFEQEIETTKDQEGLGLPDWLRTEKSSESRESSLRGGEARSETEPPEYLSVTPIEEEDTQPVRVSPKPQIKSESPAEVGSEETLEETPDWIKELIDENQTPEPFPQTEEIEKAEEIFSVSDSEELDFSKFLPPIEEAQSLESGVPSEEIEPEPLPDWLAPAPEISLPPEESLPQPGEETTPDLLLESWEETIAAEETIKEEATTDEGELPTWIREFEKPEIATEKTPEQLAPMETPAEELIESNKAPESFLELQQEAVVSSPEQTFIPTEEPPQLEIAPISAEETAPAPAQAPEELQPSEIIEAINLNTAEVSELEKIMGADSAIPQAIIDYRQSHGPIIHLEELLNLPGVEMNLIEQIRDKISLDIEGPRIETMPDEIYTALLKAREEMEQGQREEALLHYGLLIKSNRYLAEVIADMNFHLSQSPLDISVLTCLGDAYLRDNQLELALEAYNKAEQLLK